MNKSVLAGFAVGTLLSFAAITGMNTGVTDGQAFANESNTYRQLNLFGDVFERVRAAYVEPTDDAKLVENAINGMLTSLDPHSSYMNPKTYRDMQVQTRGEFGGLGIEVTMENGVVKVVTPIDDTPASRAGMRPNDYITHIDGTPILGMTLSDAVDKMRGPANSSVLLTVVRQGREEPFDVSHDLRGARRAAIQQYDDRLSIGHVAAPRIVALRILGVTAARRNDFAAIHEFVADRNRLVQQPARIVPKIDDIAAQPRCADLFGQTCDGVVEKFRGLLVEGSDTDIADVTLAIEADRLDGDDRARQLDVEGLFPALTDNSASASEIVAGALQDHRRAIILGTRSFGKGSVQTIIPLGSDGALRLTTARYYTPSGRSIQAKGIDPDIVVNQSAPEDRKKISKTGESSLPGHLASDDGEEVSGSDSFVPKDKAEDKQLLYAIDLLNGVRQDAAFLGGYKPSAMAN